MTDISREQILEAAKEAEDLPKYLRSWSEFDEIAEQAGCDMSAMDGREYETMWCDRTQFEKLCLGIASTIERKTIERCADWYETEGFDMSRGFVAAAIRALGEQ